MARGAFFALRRYRDDESEAGGSRALRQACREAFTAVVRATPRTALVDFLARGDIAARADDFWDTIHYRAPVAREIEAATAAALRAVD